MTADLKITNNEVAVASINFENFTTPKTITHLSLNSISKTHQAKVNWWNAPIRNIYGEENVCNQWNTIKSTSNSTNDNRVYGNSSNSSINLVDNNTIPMRKYLPEDASENVENSQGTKLLINDNKAFVGVLNAQEEDEMIIRGYRISNIRRYLCCLGFLLTFGLLRLVLHWWPELHLKVTHNVCSLEEADSVLIEENFQGKHKIYHVEKVMVLNENCKSQSISQSRQSQIMEFKTKSNKATEPTPTGNNFYLAYHFGSGHFKATRQLRLFILKQLRYAWDADKMAFLKLKGLDDSVPSQYFYGKHGLSKGEQYARRLAYGSNEITVPYRNFKTLLLLEVLNPFYIFQMFSVILWFTYSYYYYACVIICMTIFGITMSIRQTKKNQDALRRTVESAEFALVIDDEGNVTKKATKELVIGDVIQIPSNGCTLQCDAVLLSGNCILDESMLTGESIPVTKTPLPLRRDVTFSKKEHARHIMFCGTKVIQTRNLDSKHVHAIVINTGNITTKGGLIRSIIYPPPVDYKFERDSYKFIECLALVALIGFVYTLVTKVLRGVDPVKLAVESLDLITIVVPPALPAAMTVGRFYAQKRLEKNNIYCISPRSINVSGSIDCCCFDKTGTLTEDGLDMWGVVPTSATNEFQIPIKDIKRLPLDHFLFGMVTCHSISAINGKFMGDPLDLKMFQSTGWSLEDSTNVPDMEKIDVFYPVVMRPPRKDGVIPNAGSSIEGLPQRQSSVDDLLAGAGLLDGNCMYDLGIVREFPFSSNLQRMSVISRRLGEKNFNVYCKGSPETIEQLCRPNTLPENYSSQLSLYAKQGYRVIAMSYKTLGPKVNYIKAQRLSRELVESNLDFLGFVIMENRLKPDTSDVIQSLTSANIKTVMITGDNILTAISVAHDCGIISKSDIVVTVNVKHKGSDSIESYISNINNIENRNNRSINLNPNNIYELYYSIEFGKKIQTQHLDTKNESETFMFPCGDKKKKNKHTLHNAAVETEIESHQQCQKYIYDNNEQEDIDENSVETETFSLPHSNSVTSIKTFESWTSTSVVRNSNYDVIDNKENKQSKETSGAIGESVSSYLSYPVPSKYSSIIRINNSNNKTYKFAMVGKTWEIIRNFYPDLLHFFLIRGSVFARMSPEQKQSLIIELQNLDYCVAMCGDGANDCGALKVAHTGISLSETESSIASPFTSKSATIACVPNVIKEGRAALATSFGIFKYMATYSMIQFISVMILYSIDSNLTDKQYLYIDLGLISVFAFFFGKTEAAEGPLFKCPPLSSLISITPLCSIVLHLVVIIIFQTAGWFQIQRQPEYAPFDPTTTDNLGCLENYTLFAISSFQYIILAFVFSKSKPYRKPLWTNLSFCFSILINTCIVIYLILYPSEPIISFFQLVLPEMNFRYWMLIYGCSALIAHFLIESILIEEVILKRFQIPREKQVPTSKLKYIHVEAQLNSLNNWPQITIQDDQGRNIKVESNDERKYASFKAEHKYELPKDTALFGFIESQQRSHCEKSTL